MQFSTRLAQQARKVIRSCYRRVYRVVLLRTASFIQPCTCARLCYLAGGELEQIQFLLGHASVQTTERYLGCKQKLSKAVNDNLGLEDT
jgi:integrase